MDYQQKSFRYNNNRNKMNKTVAIALCVACLAVGTGVGAILGRNSRNKEVEALKQQLQTSQTTGDQNNQQQQQPQENNNENQNDAQQVAARTPTKEDLKDPAFFNDCVLLGDSITQGLQLFDVMDPTNIIATKGMNVSEGAKHIEEIKAKGKKRVIVLLGINDLADYNKSVEYVAGKYGDFAKQLSEAMPDANIYVQSVLPVAKSYNNSKTKITNEKINQYNTLLKSEVEGGNVHYLDINPSMRDSEGYLPAEVTSDGLHMKKDYYGYWMNVIMEHIQSVEG